MRTALNIFFVSFLIFTGFGCTAYDASPLSSEDELNELIFHRAFTPLNRIVELADFYENYRDIRGNEASVEALKNAYFGKTVELTDYGADSLDVDYWGRIKTTEEDGVWLAVLSSHWIGLEVSYTVTETAPGAYHIVYNSSENVALTSAAGYEVSLETDVTVSSDEVTFEALEIVYTETLLSEPLEIRVTAGPGDDAVRIGLCREGEFTVYPVDGVLYYTASGYMYANFRVRFYADYFEVIENEIDFYLT